jgi:hypothetical protein
MKQQNMIIVFLSIIILVFISSHLSAQQSNFTISPSPLPYPYFENERTDVSVNGNYISISASQMTMKGGFFDFKARQAMADFIAFDVNTGLGVMSGSMPGIPPLTPIYSTVSPYAPYYTDATGNASLSFLNFLCSADLEVQPFKTDIVSMILFGGFTMTYSHFTITTPYELIVPYGYSNAGQTFTGYTNTLTITSLPYGYQAGIQFDLTLAENLRISPFIMISNTAGSATMSSNPGTSSGSSTSTSLKIPSSTTYSYGMDILIGDLSIGTILQQLQSASQQNGKATVIIISVGYHFTTGDSQEKVSD